MAGLLGAPEESEAVGSLCNLGTLVPGLAAEVEVDRLPELLGEPRAATGDSLGAAGVADQPAQPRRGPTSRDRRCGVPPRRLEGLALAEQRPAVLHRAGARKGTPLQRQVHRPPGRERVGGRGRAVHARLRARARHVEDARAGDADGAGHRPTATSPYYSA